MSQLLQDYLARSAEREPARTAIVLDDERLSYAELERRSDGLGAFLVEVGCQPGDRVAVVAPKSPCAVVGMHAALKAGCAYVPIDLESPPARVARIVDAAEPSCVLAAPEAAGLLAGVRESASSDWRTLGSLEDGPIGSGGTFTRADWIDHGPPPRVARREDDAAHLLFTSGSTGVPKGVEITHRNATAFIDWAVPYFGIGPSDRNSGHPPLHFDLSTFDIYGTLAAGAELHMVSPKLGVNPRALAALIRDSELTQWFSVPSALTYLAKFDVVGEHDFPSLRRLLWCGEVLPTPVLVHWMKRLPHVRFTNLYGPTEATIASSYHTVEEMPDPSQPVPIGVACAGEELLALDDELLTVPEGEVGHLYIGGVGLSPGYWGDPEKTAEAFVADPRPGREAERIYRTGDLARTDADGLFHFLGRSDSQIKSRGYRIELGEIEAALAGVPEVRECAVVGVEQGGFEGTTICCAYAAVDGAALEPAALRDALTAALPAYMLPGRWLRMEELPKNVNGKIDRRLLRERFAEEASAGVAGD